MTTTPKDLLGRELKVGDRIAYATSQGSSSAKLTIGTILEIGKQEGKWYSKGSEPVLTVKRLKTRYHDVVDETSKPVKLTRFNNGVIDSAVLLNG